MFKPIESKPNFPELELQVLARWEKDRTFERSVEERPADQPWSFYDGPPFATGLPHYGHFLPNTIKDVVPRFWTMKGKRVRRVWGWDCHGLPVEYEIEKELKISGKQQIEAMGVATFNDACRAAVMRHADGWKSVIRRLGRWVDMDNAYRTMDPDFMESIWWVVKTLYERDLIYKGHKSMHLCPRCSTPLSNFEVTQNYKDVTDPSVVVSFPLVDDPELSVLAWTTTPWTLPGNVLLAVNPAFTYEELELNGRRVILVADVAHAQLRTALFGDEAPKVLRTWQGSELVGKAYAPLFPFFAATTNAFRVVAADFVTREEGTGVVHIAPAFGDEDYQLGRREQVPLVQHVTTSGTFIPETDWLAGKDARGSNREIVRHLQEAGRLTAEIPYNHSYPHCWRCDTALLNYAMDAWFVKVEGMRESLTRTNEDIRWVPEHLKHGRFGKWLESARDWNISRNRYWGTPLPVWQCACGERLVIGSRDELVERSAGAVTKDATGTYWFDGAEFDLHKHVVDRIELPCTSHGGCGEKMRRTPEVLDCWFESGSMPYAQRHYPFEHKDEVEQTYPADFIAEGLDQTRGWFYTLHVLAAALQIKGAPTPAFKNVLVNGLILAEDGQKMSKSKKNYPDPTLVIDTYGADAMRYALISSPAVRAEDMRFGEKLLAEIIKSLHLPLWNALSFFSTYASGARYESSPLPATLTSELDRWIVLRTLELTREVSAAYEAYDLQGGARPVADFLEELNNWFIRRSRTRFSLSADPEDRTQALATLEFVLRRIALLLAPVTPFLAEMVWERLGEQESVHLARWPELTTDEEQALAAGAALLDKVGQLRRIVQLGHAVRSKAKIPVRQPLATATVGLPSTIRAEEIRSSADVLCEELNVLELRLDAPEQIASLTVTPNPRILGKRLGGRVQELIQAAKRGEFTIAADGSVTVLDVRMSGDEVTVGYASRDGQPVESEGGIVVALDTVITPTLARQGAVRALARAVNDRRKELGMRVGQPARLRVSAPFLEEALREQPALEDELKQRLSLVQLTFGKTPDDAVMVELDDGKVWFVVEPEA